MSGSTDVLFATFAKEHSPYHCDRVIGTGRMSWVIAAHDTATNTPVALKVLKPQNARDPEQLRRFFREAEVLERIDSPGVVRILGHGTFDGFPYTALELIDGSSLDARILKHGPLHWSQALTCLTDLAIGLVAAHAQGVVHRDVKPSNVMITKAGRAKLADFGLVQIEGAARITRQVRALGTPLYTAPEVILGGEAAPRSDLYGLGAVGSEMLRGRPPFEARDYFELVELHRSDERAFPTDYPDETPRELISIIHNLLDVNPDVRPTDARALVELLARVRGATDYQS